MIFITAVLCLMLGFFFGFLVKVKAAVRDALIRRGLSKNSYKIMQEAEKIFQIIMSDDTAMAGFYMSDNLRERIQNYLSTYRAEFR